MAEAIKSTKRFGARYGRKLKERFGKIEDTQRKKHVCPYCRKQKVKRVALGIWHCQKCDAKFTGKAYSIDKKFPKEEKSEETKPDIKEAEEKQVSDENDTEEESPSQESE